MEKTVLTFGLISGAIMVGMMYATLPFMDQIGFDKGAIIGYTTMLAAFISGNSRRLSTMPLSLAPQ